MKCEVAVLNPNILLSPEKARERSQIFWVGDYPVNLTAYSLPNGATVTFEQVLLDDTTKYIKQSECCIIADGGVRERGIRPYQVGACTPTLVGGTNTQITIDSPGAYRAVLSADGVGIAIVTLEEVRFDVEVSDAMRGCSSDKELCVDTVWTATGDESCVNHIIYKKEESNCGNVRWTATTKTCGYCPSEKIDMCGVVGYGYIEGDVDADPLATVKLEFPDAAPIMVYPNKTSKHSIEIKDCNGVVIGYANNKSC